MEERPRGAANTKQRSSVDEKVTLGTGVGGGAVINGKLFEGNCSAGTEFDIAL